MRETKTFQQAQLSPETEDILKKRRRTEKLAIGSLDHDKLTVKAQYNPKDLQIDKQVPWQQHNERNNQTKEQRQRAGQQDDAELNNAPTRSMQVEMLFDGYENHESVQPMLDRLEELSSIQDFGSKKEPKRRPHHCVVAWGAAGMPPFRCVIESLSTKITMFDDDGTPLRATCTVKLKEVLVLSRISANDGVTMDYLKKMFDWKAREPRER